MGLETSAPHSAAVCNKYFALPALHTADQSKNTAETVQVCERAVLPDWHVNLVSSSPVAQLADMLIGMYQYQVKADPNCAAPLP